MDKSEAVNELAKALNLAQAQAKGAKQDSENPFYHCKYADLTSVWDACRKPLTDNGLSVTQTMAIGINGECIIQTTMLHVSGQWVTSNLQMPVETDPQKMGKAITYGRRYTLAAIVGVCPEDDDAESVTEHKKTTSQQTTKPPQQPVESQTTPATSATNTNLCTEPQRKKIYASSQQMGYTEQKVKDILGEKFGVASTKELTKKQASDLIEMIEKGIGLETGE